MVCVGGIAFRGKYHVLLSLYRHTLQDVGRIMETCKIKDCKKKHKAKGYCNKHYLRLWNHGDPLFTKQNREHSGYCSILGCKNKYKAKGYCSRHYLKYRKYGDPFCVVKEQHGMWGTPEYYTWRDMINRCYYNKDESYQHYGNRGISVCKQWRHSFITFFKDMGLKPFPKAQIDRIDNDGNYEPNNCHWVTAAGNCRNKETTILTMGKAKEIRSLYKQGNISYAKLGVMYGVHGNTITALLHNRTWP